ncbi:MAG: DUF6515 family protein [Syntrophales bacterium]
MSRLRKTSWCFTIGLILAVLSGMTLFGSTRVVHAGERGGDRREFTDLRYGHNHAYPARGQYVERMPNGYRPVFYGKTRYYFHGGAWYHPQGSRFVITAPPFGMIVPFLPLYYATIWVGGLPYYYANETYYTQGAGGYVVVEPPKGEVSQTTPPAAQMSSDPLFVYPREGQSEQKQATDRYECHSWAVSQTDYDPTQSPAGVPAAQISQKRTDYQRATVACLEGRGYTVK